MATKMDGSKRGYPAKKGSKSAKQGSEIIAAKAKGSNTKKMVEKTAEEIAVTHVNEKIIYSHAYSNGTQKKAGIILHLCKRDEYIEAWKEMYAADKKKWNAPMFNGINPMLNKEPLSTEKDNFCVVAYDAAYSDTVNSKKIYGKPVGIFSMVVTERNGASKPIGKQFVVDPNYQGRGIGKAMLLCLEKVLKEHGYTWYYIGCSKMSAGILKSFGQKPYDSDEIGDLYKFNVDLTCDRIDDMYHQYVNDVGFAVI